MIQEIKKKAISDLQRITSVELLEQWRIEYLGRNSQLTSILRNIRSLPESERKTVGSETNTLKELLQFEYKKFKSNLGKTNTSNNSVDVTLPGRKGNVGGLHPITSIIREITSAFGDMGFSVVEGTETELEHYNFDLLNIPANHPARDQWDTIWLDRPNRKDNLLRTHTSPMQVRVMEKTTPPIRVVVPGKCYRYEATDATHEWHFHQIEGLAVAENVTFSDLKGTLYEFSRRIFGPSRKVRFRCDFFPFVEPGVDMSIDWNGEWIEILGAGMVHPKVLEGVGYDSSKYTGFAFGMGPERIAMLRYNIEDIRYFFSNDLRFLSQF